MPRRRNSSDDENSSPKRRRYNFRRTPFRVRLSARLAANVEGRKPVVSDEDFLEKNKVLKVSKKPGKALNLKKLIHPKCNRYDHNTSDYVHPDIILRRGQPFGLVLIFDRDVSKEHDEIVLQFAYGDRSLESKGTLIRLKLDLKSEKKVTSLRKWSVIVEKVDGPMVRCQVTASPKCSIGRYRLFTDTKIVGSETEDGRVITEYNDRGIIFLFNAWCPDDVVYLEDEDKREEYVMNDSGLVYQSGGLWGPRPKQWNFEQFSNPVLDVTLSLLEQGGLGPSAMASPVYITRKLSAVANSNDEDGILEGRWSEPYHKNSTKPWFWSSSLDIIKQFDEQKKPVQYGQCWVFSALITSLCRALGIPTRSVTNFSSAHDTDMSMTIDKHFDCEGECLEELNDSVWNFHVWNESWFKRLDLPAGYDGWQAFDATPQEASEGVMQCGPAPLRAIKDGHVYLNYEVGFIFAEVNGDRVTWQHDENGDMHVSEIREKSVGRDISTKAVGSNAREDITLQYKYPEGSPEERQVVEFVNRFSEDKDKRNIYGQDTTKAFSLDIKTPNDTLIGDDFVVEATVKNVSNAIAKAKVKVTLYHAYYTGVASKRVLTKPYDLELKANEEKTLKVEVPGSIYIPGMHPEGDFIVYVSAINKELGGLQSAYDSFSLKKPSLELEVEGDVFAYKESKVTIRFVNTTCLTLTNAGLKVSAGKLTVDRESITIKKDIKPKQEVKEVITIKPEKIRRRRARRIIIVTMKSDQVDGIEGYKEIHVQKRTSPEEHDSSDSDEDQCS